MLIENSQKVPSSQDNDWEPGEQVKKKKTKASANLLGKRTSISKISLSPKSVSKTEHSFEKFYDDIEEDLEAINELKNITKSWELTYSEVKKDEKLGQSLLSNYSLEEIKRLIKNQRQKFRRQIKQQNQTYSNQNTNLNNGDKTSKTFEQSKYLNDQEHQDLSKRTASSLTKLQGLKQYSYQLLQNFSTLETSIKEKLITNVASFIECNKDFLKNFLISQANQYQETSISMLEIRDCQGLKETFKQISPMTAVLIVIRAAASVSRIQNEGVLLSQIFLPYLDECQDFDFIPDDSKPTLINMINSLALHMSDSNQTLSIGFSILTLRYQTETLQQRIKSEQDQAILKEALIRFGFSKESSVLMACHPNKFMWTGFIQSILLKDHKQTYDLVQIFSRLDIQKDPTPFIKDLENLLNQRSIFLKCILMKDQINLNLPQLLQVLSDVKFLESSELDKFFGQDPKFWIQNSLKGSSSFYQQNTQVTQEQALKLYNEQRTLLKITRESILDEIRKLSLEMSESIQHYCHNEYQCAVASLIIEADASPLISTIPTGQGKTWIQGLIAKYFLRQDYRVTLIEPNIRLRDQTLEVLKDLDIQLTITTIAKFYDSQNQDEVILINEHDLIFADTAFRNSRKQIQGIWSFQNKKVFCFSATSNLDIERIMLSVLLKPTSIKFQGQQQLIDGSSSIFQPSIYCCKNKDQLFNSLTKDILMNYNLRPIIIFSPESMKKEVHGILEQNKIEKFSFSSNQESVLDMRNWAEGILVLSQDEAYGVDTKFAKDAIVLIIQEVKTLTQLEQMSGRGSRSQGISQSIYYPVTSLESQQIMSKLRRGQTSSLTDYADLVKLIWKKRTNKKLYEALEESIINKERVRSINELETLMDPKDFRRLLD